MKRSTKTSKQPTFLFTIRVWAEKLEDESFEWRGKVLFVSAVEGYYFRGWLDLVEILQILVSEGNMEKNHNELRSSKMKFQRWKGGRHREDNES